MSSQAAALGNLPEWNLADLYPSPASAEFAADLKRGEAEAKAFAEQHRSEVYALHDYVMWLANRHLMAPRILFTYRVWGSPAWPIACLPPSTRIHDGRRASIGVNGHVFW